MEQQKKKRSENWSTEEKAILREIIAQSSHILEDKSTKASSNIKKAQEWKNVAKKINELMGKNRSDNEVKLAWKRMKLAAKAKLSTHRQCQMQTGGGEKPKSPSQEDLAVMAIAPHDFVVEYNDYDSDAITPVVESNPAEDIAIAVGGPSSAIQTDVVELQIHPLEDTTIAAGPSSEFNATIIPPESPDVMEQDTLDGRVPTIKQKNHRKKGPQNLKETMQESILQSNIHFKNRQLEMLEVEHQYNVKIAELKINKLELEIEILKKNNTLKKYYLILLCSTKMLKEEKHD